jgi:hypothetical protein
LPLALLDAPGPKTGLLALFLLLLLLLLLPSGTSPFSGLLLRNDISMVQIHDCVCVCVCVCAEAVTHAREVTAVKFSSNLSLKKLEDRQKVR